MHVTTVMPIPSGKTNECTRCSDDGEPSGTAGRPILDVLLREGIHNCIVVVTRCFGGTLLGTGGLVRAYQAATQAGLCCKYHHLKSSSGTNLHVHYRFIMALENCNIW